MYAENKKYLKWERKRYIVNVAETGSIITYILLTKTE